MQPVFAALVPLRFQDGAGGGVDGVLVLAEVVVELDLVLKRPSSSSSSALTKLTSEELGACSSAICLARSLVIRPEEEAFLLEEVLVAPLLEEGR